MRSGHLEGAPAVGSCVGVGYDERVCRRQPDHLQYHRTALKKRHTEGALMGT